MIGRRTTATTGRATTTTVAKGINPKTGKAYEPSAAIGYYQKSKSGKDYLRVTIDLAVLGLGDEKLVLLGFENTNKKNPKQPDMNFLKSTPQEGATASRGPNTNVQDDF